MKGRFDMKYRVFYLILLLVGLATIGYSQSLNEGFEGTFPPTGWTINGWTQSTNSPYNGAYSAYCSTSGSYIISPLLANPGVLVYYHRKASGNVQFTLATSSSTSGPWTNASGYPIFAGNGWTMATVDLSGFTNIYLRWFSNNDNPFYIDDISVAVNSISAPSITINRSSNNVILNWSTVSGATSYDIYQSENPYGLFYLLGSTSNAGYTVNGDLSIYESRFYRVTSIRGRVESNPSATVGFFKRIIENGGLDAFTLPFGYTDLSPNSVLGNQFSDFDMLIDMTDPLGSDAMYLTGLGWVGGLGTMTYGHNYWINRALGNPGTTYYLMGTVDPHSLTVHISGMDEGYWTAFGLNEATPIDLNNLVIPGALEFDLILDLTDGASATYYTEFGWFGELSSIIPAHAYWYNSTSDISFNFNYNHAMRNTIYPDANVQPIIERSKVSK